ncbi:YdeI/OmpD-associated family protein [Nafulsella turpanensis]|uniref:YdeI/OmpD-associated family protein n=1 Tax=Nafulsella turpanensis TaxID=1265690 RepID=UPI001F2B577E|nr:YdeI/OmpD-associated family protein [Nafulsella turpanensis]
MKLALNKEEKPLLEELIICLQDEPAALNFFNILSDGNQRYFSNWIESAKKESTRTRRLSQAVNALALGFGFLK